MLRQALVVYDCQSTITREAMATLTSELHRRSVTTLQTYPRRLGDELPCSELLILCVTLRYGMLTPSIAPLVRTLSPDGCQVARVGLVVVALDERDEKEHQVQPAELAQHAGLQLTRAPLTLRAPLAGQPQAEPTTQQQIRDFVRALLETPLRVDLSRALGRRELPRSAGEGSATFPATYPVQYCYV